MKNWLTALAVCGALGVCTIGVFADQFLVVGQDRINAGSAGAVLYGSGEDLVLGIQAIDSISRTPFLTSAAPLYIVSTSAGDTQKVDIDAIDSNWNRVVIRDTLTGTSANQIGSVDLLRVNRIKLRRPAVGYVRVSDQSLAHTPNDSTRVLATIMPNYSEPLRSVFSVPKDFVAEVNLSFSTAQSQTVTQPRSLGYLGVVGMRVRNQVDTTWSIPVMTTVTGDGMFVMPYPVTVGPQSDIVVAAGVTPSVVFDAISTMRVNERHE